uniref:hypothetical protein n=1 Tax=Paracoccus sp. T5 TaxID=3402161 RepID=UPI003AD92798
MSKSGEIPYSWELIESQIREAILCQATLLSHFGPWIDNEDKVTRAYLGIETGELDYQDMSKEEIAAVDITRHSIYRMVQQAYIYAYQLEGAERFNDATSWHDADALIQSWPQADAHGEPSPFDTLNDFPLRRMLETFFARWSLEKEGLSVSVRELSLLANMTVPAVRTSLSKEGIKLQRQQAHDRRNSEEASFQLEASEALDWLSKRRGFIPQRQKRSAEARTFADQEARAAVLLDRRQPFPARLQTLLDSVDEARDEEALRAGGTDNGSSWITKILAGKLVTFDLTKVSALAAYLRVSGPELAGELAWHLACMSERAAPENDEPKSSGPN